MKIEVKKTLKKSPKPIPYSSRTNSNDLHSKDGLGASFLLHPDIINKFSFKERRSLAFMLKLKLSFTNSRIYNYSASSLSKKTGISYYNVKMHVGFLVKNNFAHFVGDDLLIHSLDKICRGTKRRKEWSVTVQKTQSINDIVSSLNYILLKYNLKTQDYRRKIKRNETLARKRLNTYERFNYRLSDFKKQRDLVKYNPNLLHGSLVDYYIVGSRRLSEILGCSHDKASSFLNELSRFGKIKRSEVVVELQRGVRGYFNGEEYKNIIGRRAGYVYRIGTTVYANLGSKIEIC